MSHKTHEIKLENNVIWDIICFRVFILRLTQAKSARSETDLKYFYAGEVEDNLQSMKQIPFSLHLCSRV